ncbi:hypothetical protein [Paenibacillus paridis]|uniref:hypothetical protein n=1 Tax=Paenibacillus paridis TaxID=2583376 RepID=UPI0011238D23|nr:hypothetical protein [Paenibacillus paridis]
MVIVKKYLLVFVSASLLLFILGCNEKSQDASLTNNEVLIDLVCIAHTGTNECSDRKFSDLESFELFKTAADRAVKMQGILNYAAEYTLSITFQNQITKKYHLSLGTDREMKGLLVDLANTHEGYEIPITEANKLRDLMKG